MTETMNTYIKEHYVFQYGIAPNGSFNMTIINRLLCEEYTVCIDKNDTSFYKGHSIIQNANILVNVMKDGFDKKNGASVIMDTCECDRLNGHISFKINVCVNVIYVEDNVWIYLEHTNKHITPKQVIEHIDYRFEEHIPKIMQKLTELNAEYVSECKDVSVKVAQIRTEIDEMVVSMTNAYKRSDMEIAEMSKELDERNKQYRDLQEQYETLFKIEQFIKEGPIMIIKKSDPRYDFMIYEYIFSSIQNIHIQYKNELFVIGAACTSLQYIGAPIINFSYRNFGYLTNLKRIVLENLECEMLEFIKSNVLEDIELIGMKKLASIKYLANIDKLKKITIRGVCNVKDLSSLVKCKNLTDLVLPTGTNASCIPENVHFKITFAQ